MNLQTNRKQIVRVHPYTRHGGVPKYDQWIDYNSQRPRTIRAFVPALNKHYRNLTEAREAVAHWFVHDINTIQRVIVNALIDINRGKYRV
jgi:hypothetical protein